MGRAVESFVHTGYSGGMNALSASTGFEFAGRIPLDRRLTACLRGYLQGRLYLICTQLARLLGKGYYPNLRFSAPPPCSLRLGECL